MFLSLRHLLLNLVQHIDQAKSVEHSVDVSHSPDIPQSFRAVYHFSFNILQRQQHRTPSKALAALSAVDPQLLGELISPALLHSVYVKGKPDIVLNLYP